MNTLEGPKVAMKQIEFENVSLKFEKENIFSNVNLKITKGDFILLSGPSGVGKTSLLLLINRMLSPSMGQILFNNQKIDQILVCKLRQKVLYIHQKPMMVSGSVKHNLLFPFKYQVRKGQLMPSDDQLYQLLDSFALTDLSLQQDAQKLSVGQQQRIALIRGVILKPEVLLLDEPTSSLDEQNKELIEDRLVEHNLQTGTTFLVVNHRQFKDVPGRCLKKLSLPPIDGSLEQNK